MLVNHAHALLWFTIREFLLINIEICITIIYAQCPSVVPLPG